MWETTIRQNRRQQSLDKCLCFQKAGIRGVLVRSGKYTQKDENHPAVKPDLIVDNLKALVDLIVQQ